MATQLITDEQFLEAWNAHGQSPIKVAKALGIDQRNVYRRRRSIEKRGALLPTRSTVFTQVFDNVKKVDITNGVVIVFSDGHFWPGQITPAHEALKILIKRLKPRVLIANGDMVDGASTNRHDAHGWCVRPNVQEEIEATDKILHELRLAAPRGCQTLWNIGNHDLNFERRICSDLPMFAGMAMTRLQDHFPDWEMQWAIDINNDVMVKHRWHNGIHAGYNNTLKAGRTIVTGHLHRLLVTPWADYNGRRWGVDTGTLAHPDGPQFEYTEYNPKPWCMGFAVLTFRDGVLMPPELCEVLDGKACFRSEVIYE